MKTPRTANKIRDDPQRRNTPRFTTDLRFTANLRKFTMKNKTIKPTKRAKEQSQPIKALFYLRRN